LIQSLFFILKEGFEGLFRAKFAGFVAMVTVAISLILIGIFLIITLNLERFVDFIRSRVELEVFLDDSLDEMKIQELSEGINKMDGVGEVTFISKEMAILEFKKLFNQQESDYFETLGTNPLPASFRIKLQKEFRSFSGAEMVYNAITALDDISDEDVVYRREFFVKLEKYVNIAIAIDIVVGAIVCLSALLLVSNNIRLIILSRDRIIKTMKLVGATRNFIRFPLFIQGTVQGLLGGIAAAVFLYALIKVTSIEIPGLIMVSWKVYFLLAASGLCLGLVGSLTAMRRYL